jgi:hypothetical protein
MNGRHPMNRELIKSMRKKLVKSWAWSVALRGADSEGEGESRQLAFEMWVWRKM